MVPIRDLNVFIGKEHLLRTKLGNAIDRIDFCVNNRGVDFNVFIRTPSLTVGRDYYVTLDIKGKQGGVNLVYFNLEPDTAYGPFNSDEVSQLRTVINSGVDVDRFICMVGGKWLWLDGTDIKIDLVPPRGVDIIGPELFFKHKEEQSPDPWGCGCNSFIGHHCGKQDFWYKEKQ